MMLSGAPLVDLVYVVVYCFRLHRYRDSSLLVSAGPVPHWAGPVCTACGALLGFFIMALACLRGYFDVWAAYVAAAVTGGVTSLIGSLTRHMLKPTIY